MDSLNLGPSLIDLAALTAVIGATTAESMTLGTRGAAGLPWATISSFGNLSVIKACLAASTPGWLRDSLGVNTVASQAALGMYLRHGRGKLMSPISRIPPIGIRCEQVSCAQTKLDSTKSTSLVSVIADVDLAESAFFLL